MNNTIDTTTKPALTNAQLLAALNWRYATKKFDPAKKIPDDTWRTLEQALVLAPSSFGFQPWKFIIVTDPAMKKKLSEAAYGQPQPADASHLVVFAPRKSIDAAYVEKYVERTAQVRGASLESLARFRQMLLDYIGRLSKQEPWALGAYLSEQAHIALGQFLVSAALLGVDVCPMGGIDRDKFDELLNLKGTGYGAVVICAAGYRAAGDKYAALPKVRFEEKDVLVRV